MSSSSLSSLSVHVSAGPCFIVDDGWHFLTSFSRHLHKVFRVLFWVWFCTFQTKTHSTGTQSRPPSWVVWWLYIPMVFIPMEKLFKEMNVAPSNIWNMHTKMNHTYGAPQFSPWFLGWFLLIFPMISNKEAECLEGWPKNTLHQLNHVLSVNLSEASEAMTSSSRLPHVV